MEIQSDVYAYEVEWGYDEPLGIQVVETDAATLLFGGGTDDIVDDLVEIASKHKIDVVVVEHGDLDHYGGVPGLQVEFPDIEVAVPAGDTEFLEEAGIIPDHLLEADTTYWGVETISTPGHTPDNMSYLYDDVLVAGDTVVGASSPFAAEGSWSGALAVCTSDYNADDAQTRESIGLLANYDFDTVLLSHGSNVIGGGKEEINTLIDDIA